MQNRLLVILYSLILLSSLSQANNTDQATSAGSLTATQLFQLELAQKKTDFKLNYVNNWNTEQVSILNRILPISEDVKNISALMTDFFFSEPDTKTEDRQKGPTPIKDKKLRADFIYKIRSALAEIPSHVMKEFEKHTVAVIPAETLDNGGFITGLAVPIFESSTPSVEKQKIVAGLNLLSRKKFEANGSTSKGVNEWFKDKEESIFKGNAQGLYSLSVDFQGMPNTAESATMVTLIHELAHNIVYGRNVLTRWEIPVPVPAKGIFPWFDISWETNGVGSEKMNSEQSDIMGSFVGKAKYFAPEGGRKLDNNQMPGFYLALKKSNFITSYASKHSGEDFPEFVTYFILTQYMGVKPLIKVMNKESGETIVTLDVASEITSERYKEKYKFVKAIFEDSSELVAK